MEIAAHKQPVTGYVAGFHTDVETDDVPKGLSTDIVRLISEKKNEPEFMLNFRLKAFSRWQAMDEPWWRFVNYPAIDYQDIRYYSAPKQVGDGPETLNEVDPEVIATFER